MICLAYLVKKEVPVFELSDRLLNEYALVKKRVSVFRSFAHLAERSNCTYTSS